MTEWLLSIVEAFLTEQLHLHIITEQVMQTIIPFEPSSNQSSNNTSLICSINRFTNQSWYHSISQAVSHSCADDVKNK